jgi:S1-C subfamily serine protease
MANAHEKDPASVSGVPVLACAPGSPSALAGVRRRDVILECNGVRVHNIDDYLAARDLVESNIHLLVWRDGAEVSVDIPVSDYRTSPEDVEGLAVAAFSDSPKRPPPQA